jgi:hypothetical protein
VYLSADEFLDLERLRLTLRTHGIGVDRGRLVREAIAVLMMDLEAGIDASVIARRLRVADPPGPANGAPVSGFPANGGPVGGGLVSGAPPNGGPVGSGLVSGVPVSGDLVSGDLVSGAVPGSGGPHNGGPAGPQ